MNRRLFVLSASSIPLLTPFASDAAGNRAEWWTWPEGCSPAEIGAGLAENFLSTSMPAPLDYEGRVMIRDFIPYWETCAWYGALRFAAVAGNRTLARQLAARFDPLFDEKAALIPTGDHLALYSFHGDPLFGAVPLELYMQTKDRRYLTVGKNLADKQWTPPPKEWMQSLQREQRALMERVMNQGASWQTRLWIDDAYLITQLQVQAFRATGERIYIDRAAKEMLTHMKELQQPNGLFHHTFETPIFWGRGNGWAAAGFSELLSSLPDNHADRPRLLDGYRRMMTALLKYQGDDGMWKQLIDHPEAWPETSSTGMFTFAFVTGVKHGWLDKKIYAPTARKSWLGLTRYLNAKMEVTEVCEGTNRSNVPQYYLDRRRNTGDLHGHAAVLWSAGAFLS